MPAVSNLDFYKYVFSIALFIAEGLFLFRLSKKARFPLRLAGALLVYFAILFCFPVLSYDAIYSSLMFTCLFLLSVLGIRFCFNISWGACLFCAVAGYSIQHLSSVFYDIFITATGYGQAAMFYSGTETDLTVYEICLFLEIYLLVYWLLYHLFGRKIRRNEDISIRSPALLLLVAVILVVEILLNAVVIYRKYASLDFYYYYPAALANLFCTLSVLVIQFSLLLQKSLRNELSVVYQMWRQEQRQFQISKETIDLINLKCHDMKHQIHSIGKQAVIAPDALREMESTIEIYDSLAKTGNQALDIILAEKSLYCQKHGITISCIADGARLAFMTDSDIYSLFGNLLDNAIQAVMDLEQDMRYISITIRAEGSLLSINSNNYYSGTIQMDHGLPITTQDDRDYHGYGTRSMAMIVEKYHGSISFDAKDQIFNINILFSLSDVCPAGPMTGGIH